MEGNRPVHPHVFASQGKHRIVNDGSYKLIYDLETESSRLFHLVADPGEDTDLAGHRPRVRERLEHALFRWIEGLEGRVGSPESLEAAEEVRKELEAVGYL